MMQIASDWVGGRGYVQALVAEAFWADVGQDKRKVEIGQPVAEGMRAAECKNCSFESVVNGYVAGHACQESRAI